MSAKSLKNMKARMVVLSSALDGAVGPLTVVMALNGLCRLSPACRRDRSLFLTPVLSELEIVHFT